MVEYKLALRHDYDVQEWLENCASDPSRLYFPGAIQGKGKDGVALKVFPYSGDPWIGCFTFGMRKQTPSEIVSCPNPKQLCVVSSGAGYLVRTDDPTEWQAIRALPVCDVIQIPEAMLLVCTDYTKLVAYDHAGLKWESQRVSSDGITINAVSKNNVSITVWEAAESRSFQLELNLANGAVLNKCPLT